MFLKIIFYYVITQNNSFRLLSLGILMTDCIPDLCQFDADCRYVAPPTTPSLVNIQCLYDLHPLHLTHVSEIRGDDSRKQSVHEGVLKPKNSH